MENDSSSKTEKRGVRQVSLLTRSILAFAGLVVLTSLGSSASAETKLITARAVVVTTNARGSYVEFSVPRGQVNQSRFVTGLPLSKNADSWSRRWISPTILRLNMPVDTAQQISNLKRNNHTVAAMYKRKEMWAVELEYANNIQKSNSLSFDNIIDWLDYLNKAFHIKNLILEYGDELLGAVSTWASAIVDFCAGAWELILAILEWLWWVLF